MPEETYTSKSKKPQGYWNDKDNLIYEAKEFIRLHPGEKFTRKNLNKLGYSSLGQYLAKKIGWKEALDMLGLRLARKPKNYWSDEQNLCREALSYVEEHGEENFSKDRMVDLNFSPLANAIASYWGWDEARKKLNIKTPDFGIKPQGFWKEKANIHSEARAFINTHGAKKFNVEDMRELGYTSLSGAIRIKNFGQRFVQKTT
ncbi:MAG: hypothetical protein ED554_07930 [Synechococcus sp. YX04-3]|nr:MAG: hypothetical protein ED554_07930 [Synechococcus sp. YX04-3]